MTESKPEKSLDKKKDLPQNFLRQIKIIASELQYGSVTIEFKVRDGELKEAYKKDEVKKLSPI